MTIPLTTMTPEERERLCYVEGFTESAALFAQIDDLEIEAAEVEESIETLKARISELESALYLALPFVEDHEGSDIYKPGAVLAATRKIKKALGEK